MSALLAKGAAIAKVEASRARLRLAMMPAAPPADAARTAPSIRARLLKIPIVGGVVDSVQAWWNSHPYRPAAQVASEATHAVINPVARRHPYALVLAAAIFGAGLAWTRPWRWIFRSALFAGLLPQLATRAVTSLPIDSWLKVFGTAMSTPPSAAPPTPDPAAQAAPG